MEQNNNQQPASLGEPQRPKPKGSIATQLKQYLFLKKRDGSEPRNINIFLMHGMNRISIIIFLIAIVILIVRAIARH